MESSSLWDDLGRIFAEGARERAEEGARWYASLTPEQKRANEERELAFLRRWERMTGAERADHIRRQLNGEL